MRKRAIAAALMVSASLFIWTAAAGAVPTELTVRIEGKEKTLFEGPILTEGHDVRASSDTEARHCDGTNNGAHPEPVPTPTASSADAMELVGQSFGAKWYDGFDDYFLERWGPDEEDLGAGQFWGILVNGVLTSVGGCQYGDRIGDEVLWVYDAFSGRRLLWLAAESDPTIAPRPPLPTAHVEVGQPLGLQVDGYIGGEGASAEVQPAEAVAVAPVETEVGTGFESVLSADPSAVVTDAGGHAEVTFSTPGWHRVKAQQEAGFIRSNRLDVCVEPVGGGGCGPRPADATLRVPARYQEADAAPGQPAANGGGAPPKAGAQGPAAPAGAFYALEGSADRRRGTVGLWAVVPGPGTIELSGALVAPRKVTTSAAGTVKLAVGATAEARAQLRRAGRLKLRVNVAFTPLAGAASRVQRSVTLRLDSAKK